MIGTHIPRSLAAASIVAASGALATAQPVVITTADGDGADAFVLRQSPDANYGDLAFVRVKNAAAFPSGDDFDRKGYLRFDLPSVSDVIAASFEMTISEDTHGNPVGGPQQFTVFGLIDGIAEAWKELGITWTNAPANDTGSANGVTADAVWLGEFVIEGTGAPGAVVSLTSDALLDFVQSDTDRLLTLIVVRDTFDDDHEGWAHSFASKEHLTFDPPRLILTSSCEADLDGTGDIGFGDILAILAAWGNAGGPEDLDGSGTVDFGDLLVVLGAWGPCP